METIFDYNVTERELIDIFGFDKNDNTITHANYTTPIDIDEYKKLNERVELLNDIAVLLEERGQKSKAKKIWKQIPKKEITYNQLRNCYVIKAVD